MSRIVERGVRMSEKKVVVITGAGTGLGAALVKRFAELDYHVCLLGRRESALREVVAKYQLEASSVYSMDVSKRSDVVSVMSQILEAFGRVDVLVNNAGVGYFAQAELITDEQIDQMIDINLKGTIYCTQEVLPNMRERDAGSILNVISTAGLTGKATEAVYCASKFGVRGFTESLLVELADTNVRVLGAYMGGMKTDFWDGIYESESIQQLMDPEDVADIIMANVTTRTNLNVDQVVIKNRIVG